ncbi:MAG: NADH dehydrogenase (quinone) subunit D [bacterium]
MNEIMQDKPLKTETMILNMGPQHPSTHGVLRLVLELDGEKIVNCVPHMGYLHTGIEKTMENKTYHQAIVCTDRVDYLAPMSNNLAYCLAVEKLLDIEIPKRAQYLRVLLAELTRIKSHLVWLGSHAMDLGAMSVFLYCFREREKIVDIYESLSGVRMMSSYIRIGGLAQEVSADFVPKVRDILETFPIRIREYEDLLTHNPIFLNRTKNIGILSVEDAINIGVSGPNLRGSGVKWDIRKSNPYSSYQDFQFEIPTGTTGDVYDRYLVRVAEMKQSLKIIKQVIDTLPPGPIMAEAGKYTPPSRDAIKKNMEELIHHFLLMTVGFEPPVGEVYHSIEGPKGELGFYIVSDGTGKPYRVRIRPPSFINLQALPKLVVGHYIADVIAIIGSLDFVLGEVDR